MKPLEADYDSPNKKSNGLAVFITPQHESGAFQSQSWGCLVAWRTEHWKVPEKRILHTCVSPKS